jgi:hypothetical protein
MIQNESVLMVIADISGSMGEAAKPAILRDMINHIRESLSLRNSTLQFNKIELFLCNEKCEFVKIESNEDLLILEFGGKFNIDGIIDLFNANRNDITNRVIILSDWNLNKEDKQRFVKFVEQQEKFSIRVVLIELGLMVEDIKFMNSKHYFHPQNISKALSPWPVLE